MKIGAVQRKKAQHKNTAVAHRVSHGAGPDGAALVPPNRTGLPDALKSGVESLSGLSLDDVRVHYNSSKPEQLQALAYTQGSDIHVAPGQERHIPHEAWHVVQQKQGRVQPTMQMQGGVKVNDDTGLEREADVMGAKARQSDIKAQARGNATGTGVQIVQQKSMAHTSGCRCASCSGDGRATKQMMFNPSGDRQTIQMKKCGVCGQDPCICPSNSGPAPTGNYKNTSGHHDKTKDKAAARKVVRNYTGKRGKKPKSK